MVRSQVLPEQDQQILVSEMDKTLSSEQKLDQERTNIVKSEKWKQRENLLNNAQRRMHRKLTPATKKTKYWSSDGKDTAHAQTVNDATCRMRKFDHG